MAKKKCPECKGKTQCDCHLCWGRGYLRPQQPDDQYPGVPVQGPTPPPNETSDSFFSRKVKDMLVQAEKNPNEHGMCPFKPEEVANIRLLIGLLETDRYHLLKDVEKLEREIERLRNSK